MKTHFADDETLAELERLQKENQRLIMAIADTEALELGTSERCEKLQEELNAANERYRRAIQLGQERLAARDLVIEKMREAIQYALRKDYNCNGITAVTKLEASVLLQPSTDALKARDRKRDAALLRVAIGGFHGPLNEHMNKLAKARESGEWEPELEIE